MSPRFPSGTPLSQAITADRWNQTLETNDRVRNLERLARDLLRRRSVLPIKAIIDQGTAVQLGEPVELRGSNLPITSGDGSDQLWTEPILNCRHYETNAHSALRANFGIALEPGEQGDMIDVWDLWGVRCEVRSRDSRVGIYRSRQPNHSKESGERFLPRDRAINNWILARAARAPAAVVHVQT